MTTECFTQVMVTVPGDPDRTFYQGDDKGQRTRHRDPSNLPTFLIPFLPPSKPGKGTGLGLSVSFMIVEKLGGHIVCLQQ
jgi:signal transduction histidine kinase